MKKNWLSVFIFLLTFFTLHAQYSTPGTGVTWNLDDLVSNSEGVVTFIDNAYFINNDLVISLQDTILLEDNGTLKFQSGKLITVQGVLRTNPPDSILCTAVDTLNTFKSFRFEDSDASVLKRCRIEFGGGIDILHSDMLIEDCIFRKNDKSNSTGVIDLFFSSPQVINCKFYYNEGPAVLSGANSESSPYLYGNLIYRNNTLNTNMPQINLGTSAPGVPIRIVANTIEGFYNKAGGIAVTTLAGGNLDCIIDSNIIFNNRYGITAYGFDITSLISNNIIYDNNTENLPMQGGSGINFWGGTSNASQVYGNEIYGNLWGITNTGDALPNLGQVEPDTVNPGGNRIYGNGNLGIEYNLYNNTPNDMFAENNYWGSYDLDSVELVIFHYPDDESLGFVDYLPIMDSLTTEIPRIESRDQPAIFPNPADSFIRLERPGIFKGSGMVRVQVFNATGQPVFRERLEETTLRIDISDLARGNYVIEMSDGKSIFTAKFMKR